MMMPFLQLAPLAAERVINVMPGGLLIASLAWVLSRVVGRQIQGHDLCFGSVRCWRWRDCLSRRPRAKLHIAVQSAHSESCCRSGGSRDFFAVWMSIAALATARIIVGLWKLRRLSASKSSSSGDV